MSIFDDIFNFPLYFVSFLTDWSCLDNKKEPNNQLQITLTNPKDISYNIDTTVLKENK